MSSFSSSCFSVFLKLGLHKFELAPLIDGDSALNPHVEPFDLFQREVDSIPSGLRLEEVIDLDALEEHTLGSALCEVDFGELVGGGGGIIFGKEDDGENVLLVFFKRAFIFSKGRRLCVLNLNQILRRGVNRDDGEARKESGAFGGFGVGEDLVQVREVALPLLRPADDHGVHDRLLLS